MGWDDAREASVGLSDEDAEEPSPVPIEARRRAYLDPGASYVVTDRFDLSSVDVGDHGACLTIRRLSKLQILEILHAHNPSVVSIDERGQSSLERELALAPAPRPVVSARTKLVVMRRIAWNDVRWFLVEYQADGDGVAP